MAEQLETLEAPEPDATVEQPTVVQPAVEEPPKGKQKKPKKGKKKEEEAAAPGDGPSVAGHPRAARSIERAKGWGALAGFGAGLYFSMPTQTLLAAGLRAIVAGIVLYVAVWAGSVFFWRRMVMVEIRAREQQAVANLTRAVQAHHSGARDLGTAGK